MKFHLNIIDYFCVQIKNECILDVLPMQNLLRSTDLKTTTLRQINYRIERQLLKT